MYTSPVENARDLSLYNEINYIAVPFPLSSRPPAVLEAVLTAPRTLCAHPERCALWQVCRRPVGGQFVFAHRKEASPNYFPQPSISMTLSGGGGGGGGGGL